jgi:hypothetical protein
MKRKIIVLKFLILAAFASGCSVIEQQMNSNLANKSVLERAEQAVFGDEKTGIAECDQILERLDEQSKTANESTLDRAKRVAVKQAILNQVRARAGTTNMSQENKTFYGNRCREIYNQFLSATPAPANK